MSEMIKAVLKPIEQVVLEYNGSRESNGRFHFADSRIYITHDMIENFGKEHYFIFKEEVWRDAVRYKRYEIQGDSSGYVYEDRWFANDFIDEDEFTV